MICSFGDLQRFLWCRRCSWLVHAVTPAPRLVLLAQLVSLGMGGRSEPAKEGRVIPE